MLSTLLFAEPPIYPSGQTFALSDGYQLALYSMGVSHLAYLLGFRGVGEHH